MTDSSPRSRRARLFAILARIASAALQHYTDHDGQWPPRTFEGGRVLVQAPYLLTPLADGRHQVTVTSDDGDVLSGVGATYDEALDALEAKIR